MKSYFLRANYHALKSEFKHEFHETTFFKLTYCTHCDGLVRTLRNSAQVSESISYLFFTSLKLWGIIKQGWKCKGE
jgi:RAS guanyl-releasing protein 3